MSLIDFDDDFDELLEQWEIIYGSVQMDDDTGKAIIDTSTDKDSVIWAVPPQPVSEKEIVKDFGGEFVRDLQKTYTAEDVNTRAGNKSADKLIYDGSVFEVYKLSKRVPLGGYRKVYLRKLQGDI